MKRMCIVLLFSDCVCDFRFRWCLLTGMYGMDSMGLGQWLYALVGVLVLVKTEGINVGITYVQNAVPKGAGEFFFVS